jgi:uncharacterized protein YuzE
MTITIGGISFDRVDYDREVDVLYLTAGNPTDGVDFDETPEGHGVSYNARGEVVGLTIVGARESLERDGTLDLTLHNRIDAHELEPALR